jgi:hypothetical protein
VRTTTTFMHCTLPSRSGTSTREVGRPRRTTSTIRHGDPGPCSEPSVMSRMLPEVDDANEPDSWCAGTNEQRVGFGSWPAM